MTEQSKTIHDEQSKTTEEAKFDAEVRAAGGWRSYCLQQAKSDVQKAVAAIDADDWLAADVLLRLAVDYLTDSGVIP